MTPQSQEFRIPVGQAATLAVIREVTALKPGNVHRGADFEDVTFLHFIQSAVVIGPILEQMNSLGVGRAVFEAVLATRNAVGTNTNLGTLLLLAPLSAVPVGVPCADGIAGVLRELTFDDTRQVFEAIRGLPPPADWPVDQADVSKPPPNDLKLIEAMQLASHRDLVARQYCNAFADVLRIAAWIEQTAAHDNSLDSAIVHAYIRQLAREADSLIVRKCGPNLGEQARLFAERVLESGSPSEENYQRQLENFDFWLRADGHRRNPGTTADLIAAALFVLLSEGRVRLNQ